MQIRPLANLNIKAQLEQTKENQGENTLVDIIKDVGKQISVENSEKNGRNSLLIPQQV